MTNTPEGPEEVRLPLSTVSSLEAVLEEESPRLLLELGQENGRRLSEVLEAEDGDVGEVPALQFWTRLAAFFKERGWGDLSVEQRHPGVGVIRAEPPRNGDFPARFFGATLGGLLSSVAGDRVAVAALDISEQNGQQIFAFGAPETISRLTAEVRHADGNLDRAMERI